MRKVYFIALFVFLGMVTAAAQKRDKTLTISVTTATGESLTDQPVSLTQTDYDLNYGTLKLNADGICTVKVYAGNHSVSVERTGYETATETFTVAEEATEASVELVLVEKVKTPYSLKADAVHNAYTGTDDITMTWNTEEPAFFDDFESYEGWAIQFGEWTGIDADQEQAAPLLGEYPNRGSMQYAQIINPMTVEPTWWYDYPILRPYDGQQYVGFTRTNSGLANDDWLISPVITAGTDNVLSFMGKAGDQFAERFMVYVTTKTDNPTQEDFIRLDKGNYETADYKGWQCYSYDLSAYAGKEIRFAIRYISDYNRYRSFMLMVDDVYVGPDTPAVIEYAKHKAAVRRAALRAQGSATVSSQARRVQRSLANPNEVFHVLLDGTEVGTTEDYSYTISNVSAGTHIVGIKAVYVATESETAEMEVVVGGDNYSKLTFNVTTDSKLGADGQTINLTNTATSESYQVTVADGKAEIPSLPNGTYLIFIEEGAFSEYQATVTLDGDKEQDIALTDNVINPYNITATEKDKGTYELKWNQELRFTDSFEEYDDFATGSFGEWITVDNDQTPVYPIGLGNTSNVVSFPGSGTASNPLPLGPIVFNPWHTTPPMMPTDPAIAAPDGDKTILFCSPQQAKADKWLISPLFEIHDNYTFSVYAKGYTSMYPESMEFAVSESGSANTYDFTILSFANRISCEEWAAYETDLADYVGKTVRVAVRYTSQDAFLAQVDMFTIGAKEGTETSVDYGNVLRYDVFLDGEKVGETETPAYTLTDLTPGKHVVGVKAVYQNTESQTTEYSIEVVSTGIEKTVVSGEVTPVEIYNLQGVRITGSTPHKGVYIIKSGNTYKKRMF
ncbi:MAG: choice-of-anchor J domain-containing protein [Prevotella sp.]|nr:choice-of-anchor J domain-containing protein [Prevotella sp.]